MTPIGHIFYVCNEQFQDFAARTWITFPQKNCHLLIFFKINFFEKFFQQGHQSVKQFGSCWIQTVLKGYQQTTPIGHKLMFVSFMSVKSRAVSYVNTLPQKHG